MVAVVARHLASRGNLGKTDAYGGITSFTRVQWHAHNIKLFIADTDTSLVDLCASLCLQDNIKSINTECKCV